MQRVTTAELERDAERVIDAVQRGAPAIVERRGWPAAAMMDLVDYRLLRAFVHYQAQPGAFDLAPEPSDERCVGQDEQARYDLVMAYYQGDRMSIGRAAELLGIPPFEFQLRCARLGIPLNLGPRTIEELREEIENARAWIRESCSSRGRRCSTPRS